MNELVSSLWHPIKRGAAERRKTFIRAIVHSEIIHILAKRKIHKIHESHKPCLLSVVL